MRLDPTFGDLRALREKMMIWARTLTRGGSNAEDLVQAALLKMLSNRHRAPEGAIEPWARVVLLNEFRMARRVAGRLPAMLSIEGGREDRRTGAVRDEPDWLPAAPDNPETSTYCNQVFRRCLGLDPSLLLDPDSNGQRWEGGVAKTVTERRRRYRARLSLQQVAA
jgi:DNA-directed RNA polymerase specialized sigma24 family protein